MKQISEFLNEKLKMLKIDKVSLEGLPIRPTKKKTRLYIDNEYFTNGYAKVFPNSVTVIYCILSKYSNYHSQICFPSIDTIIKESGIKNRNTVNNAIKILEAYDIIFVAHSKGKVSNKYALLDCQLWKPINSVDLNSILKPKRHTVTVSKNQAQPYQIKSSNRITNDTRNYISK